MLLTANILNCGQVLVLKLLPSFLIRTEQVIRQTNQNPGLGSPISSILRMMDIALGTRNIVRVFIADLCNSKVKLLTMNIQKKFKPTMIMPCKTPGKLQSKLAFHMSPLSDSLCIIHSFLWLKILTMNCFGIGNIHFSKHGLLLRITRRVVIGSFLQLQA